MSGMTESKLITGDKFIRGLIKLGIVDDRTESVVISASVGEPITLKINKFGDDRLITLLDNGGVMITYDAKEAIAH